MGIRFATGYKTSCALNVYFIVTLCTCCLFCVFVCLFVVVFGAFRFYSDFSSVLAASLARPKYYY